MGNSYKDYLDENRDSIVRAILMFVGIVVIAVLIIVVVFHGFGGKTEEENEDNGTGALQAMNVESDVDKELLPEIGSQAEIPEADITPEATGEEYRSTLYRIGMDTMIYAAASDDYGNYYYYEWGVASQGEYYCSAGNDVRDGYVQIQYKDDVGYVFADSVERCENAVVLPTTPESQLGGAIYGPSACGPTAACILVNNEKNKNWDKDTLIQLSESMGYNDQGNLQSLSGGMTGPKVAKLINEYSGGELIAENVFDADSINALKSWINKGHRVLTSVRYIESQGIVDMDTFESASGPAETSTHFVVVCGYYDNGMQCTFFFADPYYLYGGDALGSVDSQLLARSIAMVNSEPQTMIVLR